MEFEEGLKHLAAHYEKQGYEVTLRPGPEDLPSFARDFQVELVGKRGTGGVLVSVKKNREELAADPNALRYAEITPKHEGWRYDLTLLGHENPLARELQGAREPSEAHVNQVLSSAENLARGGFLGPALLTAWASLEASMRKRLQAEGETIDPTTSPREMFTLLVSTGIASAEEFEQLERILRQKTLVAHGFDAPAVDSETVQFLVDTGRWLLEEARVAKQPA